MVVSSAKLFVLVAAALPAQPAVALLFAKQFLYTVVAVPENPVAGPTDEQL